VTQEAFIIEARRTAGGRRGGRLAAIHPADLAARIIDDLVERAQVDPESIDDVILGCVSQIGEQSNNIARNAVLASALPTSVPGTTVDRQCGSSQQALHFAAQAVMSGVMDIVIAGGVETMTRVPMFTPNTLAMKAGMGGYISPGVAKRFAVSEFSQFSGAEMMAVKYELSRDALDQYAYDSHRRAARAVESGAFEDEICPISIEGAACASVHTADEGIRFDVSLPAIRQLQPLAPGGRITAATSSQICDGASGVLIANSNGLRRLRKAPLARIHAMTVTAHDPVIMLDAPIPATQRALWQRGLRLSDIDLYEVNEAFASVPLAWAKALDADATRLNVCGGAIALGHPLGATGTKLMATLVHALRRTQKRFGLQVMCEGGGMANVTIVERL